MKTLAFNLNYKGVDYTSNYNEYDEEKLSKAENLIEKIVGGDCDYFTFRGGNKQFYFPKKIISESIISIVYKN